MWLVDIDGTLALKGDRSPYDWDRVGEDLPNLPVILVVQALIQADHRVAYLSGRKERCRRQTELWLATHVGHWDRTEGLWMRPDHDNRPDFRLKRDIYRRHFAHQEITGVIDDRKTVVAMWRSLGLTVLQVAEGDF
ncbi:phosphatase domain-containing protein [Sphaerisporangium aureirubrum]|uniref:Polynucleotide kinase PNKP phosphatase domain-containing protein n=1 Tax=Sphaerisporangium aureirubrum TaxID=1544736 RepID=A0ABW1NRR6_9ACTN